MVNTLPSAETIRKAQQIKFHNQGFLHLPQLMGPTLTAKVKAAYEMAEEKVISPKRLAQSETYYDVPYLLDVHPVFTELAVLPQLLPYLLATVGEDVQLIQTCARLFPPGKTFTAPWHSDLAEVLGIDLGHSPNFYVKVHFYFEDLQPDQGCLAFLPGTHRLPRETARPRPDEIDAELDAVIIVPKAGDAVLFNTHCLHMCLDNSSPADRRTLIYSYSHFWVKQFEDTQPSDLSMIPSGSLERQILGFGSNGSSIFNQRPWSAKESTLQKMRQRIGRKVMGAS